MNTFPSKKLWVKIKLHEEPSKPLGDKKPSDTLYGLITILKSLALSKLGYNTSVLTFPLQFAASVKTAISEFVWNTKPKIKHTTAIGPKIKPVA